MRHSASEYEYADVTAGADLINGEPLPVRQGAAQWLIKYEDIAALTELVLEWSLIATNSSSPSWPMTTKAVLRFVDGSQWRNAVFWYIMTFYADVWNNVTRYTRTGCDRVFFCDYDSAYNLISQSIVSGTYIDVGDGARAYYPGDVLGEVIDAARANLVSAFVYPWDKCPLFYRALRREDCVNAFTNLDHNAVVWIDGYGMFGRYKCESYEFNGTTKTYPYTYASFPVSGEMYTDEVVDIGGEKRRTTVSGTINNIRLVGYKQGANIKNVLTAFLICISYTVDGTTGWHWAWVFYNQSIGDEGGYPTIRLGVNGTISGASFGNLVDMICPAIRAHDEYSVGVSIVRVWYLARIEPDSAIP